MDWFEKLTGFRETNYADTKAKLDVKDGRLISTVSGASHAIGELEMVSLQTLRERVKSAGNLPGQLKVSVVEGDVRKMHQSPINAGALFQVASQFNLLEMTSPEVTPEEGVTRYVCDPTQGPTCAIAAGAATIYRNYCVPINGSYGQTAKRQIDGLAQLGTALSSALAVPIDELWNMQNGYVLATQSGLEAIARHLTTLAAEQLDTLREKLCIGVHRDVEATEALGPNRPHVSQAFCSALPIAYCTLPASLWEPFATLVLEAAYEATIWAAVQNAQRGTSNVVFLTLLGGGAFGNNERWIYSAIRRSLKLVIAYDLNVRLVSYRAASIEMITLVKEFTRPY